MDPDVDSPARDGDTLARATSDELMAALERTARLETRKRLVRTDSAEFVALAEAVQAEAVMIERWTSMQLSIARDTAREVAAGLMSGDPVERLPVRPLSRVLAEWREAQFRLDTAAAGTTEAEQASADIAALRDEYRRSFARLQQG